METVSAFWGVALFLFIINACVGVETTRTILFYNRYFRLNSEWRKRRVRSALIVAACWLVGSVAVMLYISYWMHAQEVRMWNTKS